MNFTDNIEDLEDLLRGVHKRMKENKTTYTDPKPPKKYKNPNPYTPASENTLILPMHKNQQGNWSV